MNRFTLLTVVTAAALATGCAGSVGYSASASSEGYGPDLVYVAPGVQVIADYDEPIFYADSVYWRFYGGTWYRSRYYTGGWASSTPPPAVLRIEQPRQFVHYRPRGWVDRRARGQQGPIVRDHREDRPRVEPRPPTQPPPPPRAAPPPPREAPPSPRTGPSPGERSSPPSDRDRRDRRDGHDDHR